MSINNDNNKEIAKELFRLAGNTAGNLFAGMIIIVCVFTTVDVCIRGVNSIAGVMDLSKYNQLEQLSSEQLDYLENSLLDVDR